MNDTHNNKKTWIRRTAVGVLVLAASAILIACGGGDGSSSSSDARREPLAVATGPSVTWAPGAITMSANPGTRQAIPVTITADTAMSNVTVSVPTALRSVVSVSPTSLGSLKAGQTATVTVLVSPSAAEGLRTLAGAITLRAGFATTSKSLPLSVSLVAVESINGVPVPPEPPKELNDLTLAGFDLNSNAVRDDVERVLAGKTPDTVAYEALLKYFAAYQRIVTDPTPTTREVAILQLKRINCSLGVDVPITSLAGLIKVANLNVHQLLFTTPERLAKGKAADRMLRGGVDGEELLCN